MYFDCKLSNRHKLFTIIFRYNLQESNILKELKLAQPLLFSQRKMSDLNINEDAQSGGEGSCSASQPVTESAFPDEDEETITMLDVIEREDKLEEEASAVLGNSDEKNCTYPKVSLRDIISTRIIR